MVGLRTILRHPDELYPMVKLKLAARQAEKQIPAQRHWAFCYNMLFKLSSFYGFLIQELDTDLRDALCVFYLVLQALGTVEEDTRMGTEVKIPILKAFHCHLYNRNMHFSCGTSHYEILMDEFHHVSTAFLELSTRYQMVETTAEYEEYCQIVGGLSGVGLSKLFHASGKQDLPSDEISNSMGLFLQKTSIIRDYLVNFYEIPRSHIFWPREIWSKYVDNLEDLKAEENSVKAVQCLNDMVTNALVHVEDCLKYMSGLRNIAIFRFCAIIQIMSIGTLALCYNNIQFFRGVVSMRRGLVAKVILRTETMLDVYWAFYDFSLMLKSKVDDSDRNAGETKERLEAILKICRDSGILTRKKSYVIESKSLYNATTIAFIFVFIIVAILLAYLSANHPQHTRSLACIPM